MVDLFRFPGESSDTPVDSPITDSKTDFALTSSLTDLQTDEQRTLLDTVAQMRKCGISGYVSLPQLVACGQQSAGKSSVIEAITGVPFPTGEGTCTRITTEVHLRRADVESLTVRIIADEGRPAAQQAEISVFRKTIANFNELPSVIEAAKAVMGIKTGEPGSNAKTSGFAKDVLSIEIEGPTHPQLTIVDIPGLVENPTDEVTKEDIPLIAAITDKYISEPRTICLAIVPASGDLAMNKIMEMANAVDPRGNRTLGIITKPDRIQGDKTKDTYLKLAKNETVQNRLKLGWHVLRNRSPEEQHLSLEAGKAEETKWLANSAFKALPPDHLGIDALKRRLSILLCDHVKRELPKLRAELDKELGESESALESMGDCRSSVEECKQFLTNLSMRYFQICKSAIDGHYGDRFFHRSFDASTSSVPIKIRAKVQSLNFDFNDAIIKYGYMYHFVEDNIKDAEAPPLSLSDVQEPDDDRSQSESEASEVLFHEPIRTTESEALEWVREKLRDSRGKELVGNYNPLLVGELFWEQAKRWNDFAEHYIEGALAICKEFLRFLLQQECPADIQDRIWGIIDDELKRRRKLAYDELEKLKIDLEDYPINYNHYYTDNIQKLRGGLDEIQLAKCIEDASTRSCHPQLKGDWSHVATTTTVDVHDAAARFFGRSDVDMEAATCKDALIAMRAIYKVSEHFLLPHNLH
jgi:GTP-binding protein EngB required for normal cell division